MEENRILHDFIDMAIQSGGWMLLDRVYLTNRIISIVGEVKEVTVFDEEKPLTSKELIEELLKMAIGNNRVSQTDTKALEVLSSELRDLLTPPPSVVNALFSQYYENSEKEATDYFHLMNVTNGYINETVITKEEMTINKSQFIVKVCPEQVEVDQTEVCDYCFASEGYGVFNNRNKRIIRMNVKGESWGFSYSASPNVKEQCLFMPEEHSLFVFNRQLQETMLNLVDIYPHYFVTYNPKVTSSLPHGYLYGGEASTPLIEAENDFMFDIPGFVTIEASLVEWPVSVIRLKTSVKKNLINAMEYLTLKWQQYSYPSLDIIAKDENGENLHSVTPIFRKDGDAYVAELVLNDDSSEFSRMLEYENLLLNKNNKVDILGVLNLKETEMTTEEVIEVVTTNFEKQQIFKKTPEGQQAFVRFIDTL